MKPARYYRDLCLIVLLLVIFGCNQSDSKNGPKNLTTEKSATDSAKSNELPVLVRLPEFTLQDQNGAGFGSAQLNDKPWIANFVFLAVRRLVRSKLGTWQNSRSNSRKLMGAMK